MAGALNFVPETRASPPRASLTADDRGGIHAATAMPAGPGRIAVSLRRTVGAEGSLAHSGSLLWSGTRGLARFGALLSAAGGETEAPDWSVPTDATRSVASLEGWMGWRNDLLGFSADLGARRTQYDSTTPTVSDDDHREGGGSIAADWSPDILPLDLRISAELSGRLARSTSIGERGILTADLALTGTWQGPFTLGGSSRIGFSRDGAPLAGASLTASAPLRGGSLTVHLTGSAGFRRPTLNDLFWPGDAFAVGNPDLGPERSLEVEAGLSMPAGRPLALSLTAFLSVTDDLIRWEPGEGGRWSPVNLGRVRRRGVEAECRAAAGPLSLLGVLTLLEVTDRDPSSTNVGCALPYVPDCTFGLKADLGLPWGLSSWAAVDGVGTRFLNYGATAWLPPYALLSAGLTVPVPGWRGGSLSLSGTNLLDRAYQESNGYGGEPRTLRATLGWEGPGSPR